MLKSLMSRFALVAALVLGASVVAHADSLSVNPVDADGSTTIKNIFSFDETPYIHLHLPGVGLNFAGSFWNSPTNLNHFASHGPSTDQDIWFSLTNWNTVREQGNWGVIANFFSSQGLSGSDQTSFTVTPEPLSAALFVVGGLTLAAATRRKKNALNA